MIIKIPVLKGKEQVFFLSYGIFLVFAVLSASLYYKYFAGTLYTIILMLCLTLLVFDEIFFDKITIKSLFPLLLCLALYILIAIVNGNAFGTLQLIPIYIYCSRKIDFKRISYFTIFLTSILFLFIFLSAKAEIIENYVVHSASGRTRAFLGFRYVLYPAVLCFNISALIIYIRREKKMFFCSAILLAINWIIFQQTNARLSFYTSIILILGALLLSYKPKFFEKRKVACWLMIFSYILSFTVSLLLSVFYSNSISWMRQLNDFLGNRLAYAQASLVQYGVTWFGQSISWVGFGLDVEGNVSSSIYTPYNYVDCLYVQMLQHYGIVLTVLVIVIFTVVMYRCYKSGDYTLLMILSVIALKSMIDDLSIYLYYNTFWFPIGYMLIETVRVPRRQNIALDTSDSKITLGR